MPLEIDGCWPPGPFAKETGVNPCLGPGYDTVFTCPVRQARIPWEEKDVFNPAAVVRDGLVYLLYRAEDRVGRYAGTSRLGLAWSADGRTFTRHPEPVLYPGNDAFRDLENEGGCEDPRVVEDEDGIYYLTYTAYDGRTARLCVAASRDLLHWEKHGPAFASALGGKYARVWSKSGSIAVRPDGERMVAAKIGGRYWMYWGEDDIYCATSENLLDWTPLEHAPSRSDAGGPGAAGGLLDVLRPRRGRFDSVLVEPGPPAIVGEGGILLIYNGKNSGREGDPALSDGAYAAGWAVFDPRDPTSLRERCDAPLLAPDQAWEAAGQVPNVTFAAGLVRHGDEWLLYYGAGDSRIAVARCPAGR